MAMDTVAGLYFATGRVQALRELVDEMVEFEGPLVYGAYFRRAQADALDGDADAAERGFLQCIEGLSAHPGTEGAIAAAHGELGGLLRVLGRDVDGLKQYEKATALWDAAARRAGRFLAEADRARAVLATGGDYVPSALDRPISFCVERGLLLVEGHLRLARGLCRHKAGVDGSREDLNQAIAIPLECGARLQAGRARFAVAKLSSQPEAELARAHRELQVDVLSRERIETMLSAP